MFKVFTCFARMVRNLRTMVSDGLSFFAAASRRRTALPAENLFLRKQLALFREREKKARPTTPADRFVFSKLAHWFDWRSALLIVKTSHFDRLASQRVPFVLALEIETGREATSDSRSQGLDPAFSG